MSSSSSQSLNFNKGKEYTISPGFIKSPFFLIPRARREKTQEVPNESPRGRSGWPEDFLMFQPNSFTVLLI